MAERTASEGRRKAGRLATAFALCLLISTSASRAQPAPAVTPAAPPAVPPAPRFVHLTPDDGLSDDTVQAIFHGRRGFIWFGTPDGLDRWDGYSFKVYRHDPDDPTSLSRNYVTSLAEDAEGQLWVGTLGGLHRYDRELDRFTRFRYGPDPSSLSSDLVFSLLRDSRGRLWVGTGAGLDRYDAAGGGFVRYHSGAEDPARALPVTQVSSMLEDRHGDLWVGARDGLVRLDSNGTVAEHFQHDPSDPASLADDTVRSLAEDANGDLWIGSYGGLERFDRETRSFEHFRHDAGDPASLGSDHVEVVFVDSLGQLWIGSDDGGLDLFDPASRTFRRHPSSPFDATSLPSNVVRTIYEDHQGAIWVGTYSGGASYFNRATAVFEHYRHLPGDPRALGHDSVKTIYEEADGRLWIGTQGGLDLFDPEAGRVVRSLRHDPTDPGSLSARAALSVLRDRRGRLWVGTFFGGLNRLDPGSSDFVHYRPEAGDPRSLRSPHVWDLLQDHAGELWLATFGGVARLDDDEAGFVHYQYDPEDPSSLANDTVWQLFEDSRGTLWAQTTWGISRRVPESDSFFTYRHVDGDPTSLAFGPVLTMAETADGRLWVGTEGGGLSVFDRDTGTFETYSTADGLASNVVYGILEDAAGRLWVGTNAGLSKLDLAAGTFTNYDKSDGVLSVPFFRNAFLKSADGRFYVGGAGGLDRFRPEDVRDNTFVPPIVLTDLQVFNRPVDPGGPGAPLRRAVTEAEDIWLRSDQSVFTLSYAALSYRAAEKNRYAYRLQGFDKGWIDAGNRRTVTYTNLDPGTYEFRVKGSNNSGVWNESGAAVRIHVAPAYWETWWFRGAALLALAAFLAGAHGWRLRGERQRNAELLREIAKRRQIERERERLLDELAAQNAELAAKNAELDSYAHTVSHDLKSPLVTIRGFASMLREDALAHDTEAMEEDLEQIETATDKMLRLLDDLLHLSRVGRVADPSEALRLDDVVADAAARLAGPLAQRGVALDIEPGLPGVIGDRARLVEVFQNLIENAARFMGDQAEPRIVVTARHHGKEVECRVCDNGVGIDPRHHEQIFGLFERLSRETEGTGVGLALVKRIVECHGGRIWVESDGPGKGSTFRFTLTWHEAAEPTADRAE